MSPQELPNDDVSEGDPARSESGGSSPRAPDGGVSAGWEWWIWTAGVLAVALVAAWGVVLARLGPPSLYTQIFIVPIVGGLTLPVIFWGLVKTVFNPPLVRTSRLVGFALLVGIGLFGTVPMFPVPLATADWQTERSFRLPFDSEWYTLAGGPALERNYHATTAAYRWGYDFAPVEEGSRFEGEGVELSDYYCVGEPVVAPADGEVVRVEQGREDFPPREFDEESVLGNHVALRIEEGVYLFVAHLRQDSVPVEVSETVERGDKLGECGNSGRAVEPHVHIHLQDRNQFPVAQGLPLRFSGYWANGESVDRGMPLGEGEGGEPAGQMVEPR
jgi:hypothetical protein